MAYADYTFYTTEYLGSAIAQAAFPALALKASAFLDVVSFGRAAPIVEADEDADLIKQIGLATCAVAEEIQAIEAGRLDGVQSESIGNYSVTYSDNAAKQLTNDTRKFNAAALYLSNSNLLYRGFMSGE